MKINLFFKNNDEIYDSKRFFILDARNNNRESGERKT